MKTYSVLDPSTGLFTGQVLTLPERLAALNTPAGHELREGAFDHLAQRVDLATGEVVAWAPPKDHPAIAVRALAQRERQVRALEAGQARAIRALALNPSDAQARARLEQIEAEITATGIRNPKGE